MYIEEFNKKLMEVLGKEEEDFVKSVLDIDLAAQFVPNVISIYVRKAYRDLYRLIYSDTYLHRPILILGSPGIGKTVFALYILYRALKDGQTVLFHSGAVTHLQYIFDPTKRVVRVAHGTSSLLINFVQQPQNLYLYDVGTHDKANYVSGSARAMVFSSPCQANYANLVKHQSFAIFYMPIWTFEEVLFGSCMEKLSVDETIHRYSMVGGIPRLIFNKEKFERNAHEVDVAVQRSKLQSLRNVSKLDMGQESHRIFILDVKNDYSDSELKISTPHIRKRVYDTIMQKKREETRMFIFGSKDKNTSLRGDLFEEEAHQMLSKGGTFNVRKLSDNEEESVHFSKMEIESFTLKKVPSNKFLVPDIPNFPSIDSISTAHTPAAFQCTVAPTHPVKVMGLKLVLKALKDAKISTTGFRLYFVVPDDKYENFKKQKYINDKGDPHGAVPRNINAIEQYALCISLDMKTVVQ